MKPITLTDAFGCDRCSLMFVIDSDGHHLVQLGGIDPTHQTWFWSGTRWQLRRLGMSSGSRSAIVLGSVLGLTLMLTLNVFVPVTAVVFPLLLMAGILGWYLFHPNAQRP
ncbi:MAG: hypothetical protein HC919_07315 [Oscillatoriales cyanobacterium SM2_2_1]|nr:hypothetical protein [Oscillatoriales cyanobacterium SM2_2_1]